jgi:expansin (peptidoglycan-binding protein)
VRKGRCPTALKVRGFKVGVVGAFVYRIRKRSSRIVVFNTIYRVFAGLMLISVRVNYEC